MKSQVLLVSLLVLITALLFGPTVSYEFVDYDDPAYVTENGIVTQGLTPEGVWWAFTLQGDNYLIKHLGVQNLWHPMTWVSHMLDCQLFGHESAFGHHLSSVVLHTLTGVIVFFLAQVLGFNVWQAFLGALLFIAHPMKTESVAWVSERKDALSGFFFVFSLLLVFLKDGRYRRWALGLFVLALLSKPSVVVLPPFIVLLMLWKRGEDLLSINAWIQEGRKWVSWFVLSAAVAVITVSMQAGGSHQAFMDSLPLSYRLYVMGSSILYYLYHVVWPVDLNFHYPQPRIASYYHIASWLIVVGVFFGSALLRKRFPAFFGSVLAFLICLLPVSGLVYVGTSFTCDRYVYLASLIPSLYFAKFLLSKKYLIPVAVIITGLLVWRTSVQARVWENSVSLFEHATKAQPKDPLGWTNLGAISSIGGDKDKAIECYQKALEINPTEYIALHNLGDVYRKRGDLETALEKFKENNEIAPSYVYSWRARGQVLSELERYEEAIEVFKKGFEASKKTSIIELWLVVESQLRARKFEEARTGLAQLKTMTLSPVIQERVAQATSFFEKLDSR